MHPSAFVCRLSCSVGRYAPPVKSRFILRRVTVYHRRSYRHHSHHGSHSRRSQGRSYRRRPDAEVGARSAVPSRSDCGSTGRIRFLSVRFSSGKRGSAHHSLRRRVACYPILRMGAPEHSPWHIPRGDLNDSSCWQWFSVTRTYLGRYEPGPVHGSRRLRQVAGALGRQPQRHRASPVLRDRIPKIGEGRIGEVRTTRLLRGWVSKVKKEGLPGEGDTLANATGGDSPWSPRPSYEVTTLLPGGRSRRSPQRRSLCPQRHPRSDSRRCTTWPVVARWARSWPCRCCRRRPERLSVRIHPSGIGR